MTDPEYTSIPPPTELHVIPGMEGVALALGLALLFCLILWCVFLIEAENARKGKR
jgi:hypothetical protein